MDMVERREEFDSVAFEVKKSRFDKNELLLVGCLDDVSDLEGALFVGGSKEVISSGRPHFLRCRLNSSSFSLVSPP